MKTLNDLLRSTEKGAIVWSQPKLMRRQYELANADDVIGHLRFEDSFGSRASADLGSERWTFQRDGCLNPRVKVWRLDSDQDFAVFRAGWSGSGALEFADGHQVQWRSLNFWRSQWCFLQNDQPLISFKPHYGIAKLAARLEVEPTNTDSCDLALLAALGWYLMLLVSQDATIVALTGAIAG
jgi:hypothetical protein